MTVPYTKSMATQYSFLWLFWILLPRWRGSIYRHVWKEILAYLLLYYISSAIYWFVLNERNKTIFEQVVIYFSKMNHLVPVAFVLGFFVTNVFKRWWDVYQSIPWPDQAALLTASLIVGQGKESKRIRETVIRNVNAVIAMTFQKISPTVREKYPTLRSLIEEGFLTEEETLIIEKVNERTSVDKIFMPIMWACKTVDKAQREEFIATQNQKLDLMTEILAIQNKCLYLSNWSDCSAPLAYCQVVAIIVYFYFFSSVVAGQSLNPEKQYEGHTNVFFPVFSLLQLFFFIGWLKVGESFTNPFGSDDDDFEFLSLLECHKEMSIMLCDQRPGELPRAISVLDIQGEAAAW
ncbi:bestrophin-2-like [Palaemon carinicauda]|uniref:bestrophin-2-like n=1 Tax=Palaemon carinicauda TaxID=392227 RepID=UPI0035B69563